MKLSFGCELAYRVMEPTVFVLHVEAARIASHVGLVDELQIAPDLPRDSAIAPNSDNRTTRFVAPPGALSVAYNGTVDLQAHVADPATVEETAPAQLAPEVMPFLLPSRYCESDRLEAFAKQQFGALLPGFSRVTAICNWICDQIDYRSGSSNIHTSACQTLEARAGVCRDFAHLGIAICRALDIPARFVSCYAFGLDPTISTRCSRPISADIGGFSIQPASRRWTAWCASAPAATPPMSRSARYSALPS